MLKRGSPTSHAVAQTAVKIKNNNALIVPPVVIASVVGAIPIVNLVVAIVSKDARHSVGEQVVKIVNCLKPCVLNVVVL